MWEVRSEEQENETVSAGDLLTFHFSLFTLSWKAEGNRVIPRHRAVVCFLALLLAALPVLAAGGPFVKGLTWRYQDQNLVVSFAVASAFDRPDLKEAIMSTRPVSLTFTVEVLKHRFLWSPRTVVRCKVVHTVQYDNLTRQFALKTKVNGEVTDERVVGSWEEMARYMEEVVDLKVTSVANLDPSEGTYTVRAQVHVLDDFTLWIIPWDVQTPWVSQTLSTP